MTPRTARHVCAAAVVAVLARLVAAWVLPDGDRGTRGFDFYVYMADHVRDGRGLCWAFYDGLGWKFANRAPLYPLFLAAARSAGPAAVAAGQALIGGAAVFVTAHLAGRWGGTRAAAVAAWAAALWPYSVLQDVATVEHVLYAPLCVASVALTLRACDPGGRDDRRAFAAGAVAAAATLARLTHVVSVPVSALAAGWRKGASRAALLGLGAALVAAPWLVRNLDATGHAVLGTDGGRALWVGSAPETFRHYPDRSIDEGERELIRSLPPADLEHLRSLNGDEVAQDAAFRSRALATIASDPPAFAGRAVRKAAALWSLTFNPGPASAVKRAVFTVSLAGVLAVACAAAAWCPRIRTDLPVVLGTAAAFTASAAMFWGQSRYLAPLHGIALAMGAAWLTRRPGGVA